MTFVKPTRSKKQTSNDKVMTNPDLAKWIIQYFKPHGIVLDPAKGTGNFYKYMPKTKDYCEITENRDFLKYNKKVDWIITNPPYSIYDEFLIKAFEIADNIVFLVPLGKAFKSRKIDNYIVKYGGLKEIVFIGSGGKVGFGWDSLVVVYIINVDIKRILLNLLENMIGKTN